MRPVSVTLLAAIATLFAVAAEGEVSMGKNGSDLFVAAPQALPALEAEGDVFAAGRALVLRGETPGDVHALGFSVEVETPVGADLYAAGASVTIRAPVAQDLTAAAVTLRLAPGGDVAQNARLTGSDVFIEAPIGGALSAAGAAIHLDAAVTGDVSLAANDITFGPGATIGGRLNYAAPEPLEIPESVIPAGRVSYEKLVPWEAVQEMGEDWQYRDEYMMPEAMTLLTFYFITLGFLVAIGALMLALMPEQVARMRDRVLSRPWRMLLSGVIGLSVVFGLVPIAAMTVIGIPLVPVVLLAGLMLWSFGYVIGVYIASMRVFTAFGGSSAGGLGLRLAVLTLGIVIATALNFIPLIGWMFNFALLLLGVGAVTALVFGRLYAPSTASASV